MATSLTKQYLRSEYEVELQGSIDSNLASISSDITTINAAVSTFSGNITSISSSITSISGSITTLSGNITTLSGNITTLSGNITTLSGNITFSNDFINVITAAETAIYTLSLATYRNFTITNTDTADKTLKISSAATAADTMLNLSVMLTFTTTATITYTGTITWQAGTGAATAPNPSAAGTFLLNLKSFDAGISWFASYTGLY